MTKRDLAHFAGWVVLMLLLWKAQNDRTVAMATAISALKTAENLKGRVSLLEREQDALKRRVHILEQGPSKGEWDTYKWYVDELRAERGAREQRPSSGVDEERD